MKRSWMAIALALVLGLVAWLLWEARSEPVGTVPFGGGDSAGEPEAHTQFEGASAVALGGVVSEGRRAVEGGEGAFGVAGDWGHGGGFLRVLDLEGRPIAGARLLLLGPPEEGDDALVGSHAVLRALDADAEGWLPWPLADWDAAAGMCVAAPGHLPQWTGLRAAGQTFRLTPSQPFAGELLQHGSDRPLGGVTIQVSQPVLLGQRLYPVQQRVTEDDGGFAFAAGPRGGSVYIDIWPDRQAPLHSALHLQAGQEDGYQVFLVADPPARLRFVDAHDGTPLAKQEVELDPGGAWRADEFGEVRIERFAAAMGGFGRRTLNFRVNTPDRLQVHVSLPQDVEEMEVPLARGGVSLIRVQTPAGEPVKDGRLVMSGGTYDRTGLREYPSVTYYPWGATEATSEAGLWRSLAFPGAELKYVYLDSSEGFGELVLRVPAQGLEETFDFRLKPWASLEGRLVGASVPFSTWVHVRHDSGVEIAAVQRGGRFTVPRLPSGTLTLSLSTGPSTDGSRFAFAGARVVLELEPGERRDLTLEVVPLRPSQVVEGVVVDGENRPLAGALVRLLETRPYSHPDDPEQSSRPRHWLQTTDAVGAFRFQVPSTGEAPYQLAARFSDRRTPAQVFAGDTAVVLRLERTARLRLRARDAETHEVVPAPGVFLRAENERGFEARRSGDYLREGWIEVDVLPGRWEVRLFAGGYAHLETVFVEVEVGAVAEVEQYLVRGSPLEIQVSDYEPGPHPIPKSVVLVPEVRGPDLEGLCESAWVLSDWLTTPLDSQGRGRLPSVPPGWYRVFCESLDPSFAPTLVYVPKGDRTDRALRLAADSAGK